MCGDKISHEDILGLLVRFLVKCEYLLFLLVHSPHGLERESKSAHAIHGFEEIPVNFKLVLGMDWEVEGGDAVVVSSLVGNLEQFSLSLISDSGQALEFCVSLSDIMGLKEKLVRCNFTGNSVPCIHFVPFELLYLLNSVDRGECCEVDFASHELQLL